MAPQAGPTPEEVASECLPGAILTGLKAAAISLVLSCGIFYAVHRNSALFRSLNVSGKTSLVVRKLRAPVTDDPTADWAAAAADRAPDAPSLGVSSINHCTRSQRQQLLSPRTPPPFLLLQVLPVFFNGYQAIEGAMQDCVKQHRSTEHAKRMQEQENS